MAVERELRLSEHSIFIFLSSSAEFVLIHITEPNSSSPVVRVTISNDRDHFFLVQLLRAT